MSRDRVIALENAMRDALAKLAEAQKAADGKRDEPALSLACVYANRVGVMDTCVALAKRRLETTLGLNRR